MNIVIVTNYWHFPSEKQSSRYLSLAQLMADEGWQVNVVTSQFYHASKSRRDSRVVNEIAPSIPVHLVDEPGYKRNISLRRIWSLERFAANVVQYLRSLPRKPDVIYCVVPSVALAARVGKFARANAIKFVIDVQDLWPEAFEMALPSARLGRWIFAPLSRRSNRVYNLADAIVAVSETYRLRALMGRTSTPSTSVFLGVDMDKFDDRTGQLPIQKRPGELWIAYAGSLGHSYDLATVLQALSRVRRESSVPFRFVVMGAGARLGEFRELASTLQVPTEFLGSLSYADMAAVLRESDIAVNSIDSRSKASIINKHGDYLAAGIPMVNNQKNAELSRLLEDWRAGITCPPSDPDSMAGAFQRLMSNETLREDMGVNARKLALAKFSRRHSYPEILRLVAGV